VTGTAENTSADVQGDTMTTTLTAICSIPGADRVMTPRRADARLAPGGPDGPRERDTRVARTQLADEAARWQLILDLLDPDKRCGAWSPATAAAGRPLRHDDHGRRRANQLRTGRWGPTAALRPGRDSRWDVASNHYGAAGRAPGPGGGPEEGRR
jgi:hypothetical protein